MKLHAHDRGVASGRRKLPNGMMQVDATFSRSGIQHYAASELGLTDRPANDMIAVWRPPEEVFKAESMASLASLPVTNDHAAWITPENAKQHTMGWSGDVVSQAPDGIHVAGKLVIADSGMIALIEAGKAELSVGYEADYEFTAGTTPTGETYDAIQRNIIGNHHAVVDYGRCGGSCRIADQACKCGETEVADAVTAKTRMILVDGLQVETTDAGAAAIEKLQAEIVRLNTAMTTADAAHAVALKVETDKIAALDAEIAVLKPKILEGAALDAAIQGRTKLIGDAKRIAGDKVATDGKSDAEIRKAAVTLKLGDAAVAGKEDAFFTHAFDMLLLQAGAAPGGGDPLRQQLSGAPVVSQDAAAAADAAQAAYEKRLEDAWKGPAAATTGAAQ